MKPALSGKATRGSFGVTYGDTHDSEGDTESSTRGTSTKKNRRDKNKNKNKSLEDKKSSTSERVSISVNPGVLDYSTLWSSSKRPFSTVSRVCRGCGGNHWI
jgi:hypothetical protein